MTLREQYAAGLIRRGEALVKRTFKYDVYSRTKGGFYYLGRAGGLRYGPTIAASHPVSQKFKDILLGIAEVDIQSS